MIRNDFHFRNNISRNAWWREVLRSRVTRKLHYILYYSSLHVTEQNLKFVLSVVLPNNRNRAAFLPTRYKLYFYNLYFDTRSHHQVQTNHSKLLHPSLCQYIPSALAHQINICSEKSILCFQLTTSAKSISNYLFSTQTKRILDCPIKLQISGF